MAGDYDKLSAKKAVELFRKKINIPTVAWDELVNEQNEKAFNIAGMENADMLARFRKIVDDAVTKGQDFETFKDGFDKAVEETGWNPKTGGRARVIYETNMRTAYAGGREAVFADTALRKDYYAVYIHDHPAEPRPSHKALHGKVFALDDPIWNKITPPNGFGCKCSKQLVPKKEAKLSRTKPDPDEIAEKGFGYRPGGEEVRKTNKLAQKKADSIGGKIGTALRRLLGI